MPLVFNGAAFIQAIILAACLGVLYLITETFDVGNTINGDLAIIIQLQAAAIITLFTDIKGIKGRLFFLPTWIVALVASIFFLTNMLNSELADKYSILIYSTSLLIAIAYFYYNTKQLRKNWIKKKELMKSFKAETDNGTLFDGQFWKIASHLYYKPTGLFLHANPIWRIIYRNAIDADEFLEYYKTFIGAIDREKIDHRSHKAWNAEFNNALKEAQSFKEYAHPFMALSRLANLIDLMNKKYN